MKLNHSFASLSGALLACFSATGMTTCATFSPALADLKSVPDVAPPSLVASPACPEAADMLTAFHQGALKGSIAEVSARVDDVLTRCPRAWEAHEVAALVARLAEHRDDELLHWMSAAADLRAKDTRFFLAEMTDDGDAPTHLVRTKIALLEDLRVHHPDPSVRATAAVHALGSETELGDVDVAKRAGFGIIERWQIVGAFDNDQGKGFLATYPPEENVDLTAEMKVLVPVHWRKAALEPNGIVPIENMIAPEKNAVAYLATWLHVDAAKGGKLLLTTDAAFRVFIDGRLVGEEQKVDTRSTDAFSIPIELAAGDHLLLIKSANESGSWGVRARIVDDNGAALAGVVASDVPAKWKRDTRAANPHVDVEPKAAGTDGGGARILFVLARTASHAGLVREALEGARLYATASKDSALAALLVADLEERNQEAGKAIDLVNKTIGSDASTAPAALVLKRARFNVGKQRYDAAQDDLRPLLARDPAARSVLVELAHVYGAQLWHVDRAKLVDAGLARWPDCLDLLDMRSLDLKVRGFHDDAGAVQQHIVSLAPRNERALSSIAFENGGFLSMFGAPDLALGERAARALVARDPTRAHPLTYLANIARLRRDDDSARAFLAQAIALLPDDAKPYEDLGDIAYEHGDTKAAIDAWKKALERNPSDSKLALHVEFVSGEGLGVLKQYAPTREDIDKRIADAQQKPAASAANVVTIFDHEATEVFGDGSSRAVATLVKLAVNQRGRDEMISANVPASARILDAHSITPGGESQDASSIKNGTIRFRKLDVGSVTVVQYVVHNTRERSFLPNHYVGNFTFSGLHHDVRESTWILLTPKGRPLVRHLVGNVKETVVDAGEHTVRTWTATNLAPVVPEPMMPPSSDVLARVSVSTLDTWDEYVRWERALLQDAFRTNPEVDAVVAKIFDGATSRREKVERAFQYVSKEIRYQQDYETTIAGVKPHACPVVLERGYGDCKDKAVLFIQLLKKAGVDADFALLRTTPHGAVERDVPNQQFNHAIIYVPKQDGIDTGFFTDATVDALDVGNLRSDDQGATSLVLDPDTGKWRFETIPYQTPELQKTTLNASIDIGAHTGHLDMVARGDLGELLRKAVRDEATARKTEETFASLFWPGATLVDGKADTSEDVTKPMTLAMNVDASAALHDEDDGLRVDVPHYSTLADATKLAERKHALRLGAPATATTVFTLALPAGKKVLRAPGDFHVTHACFVVDRKTATTPTSITITQSFTRTCAEIAPGDYADFRARALDVVTRENDPLVLSK
jgi:tetratricopeptide (TPR) repeat protein